MKLHSRIGKQNDKDFSLARLTLLPGGFFCCRGFFLRFSHRSDSFPEEPSSQAHHSHRGTGGSLIAGRDRRPACPQARKFAFQALRRKKGMEAPPAAAHAALLRARARVRRTERVQVPRAPPSDILP